MKDWMRRLRGLKSAAIARVDATTARVDSSPVRATKALCWSRGGGKIVFVRYPRRSDSEIFVMNKDGSGQKRLTNTNNLVGDEDF